MDITNTDKWCLFSKIQAGQIEYPLGSLPTIFSFALENQDLYIWREK